MHFEWPRSIQSWRHFKNGRILSDFRGHLLVSFINRFSPYLCSILAYSQSCGDENTLFIEMINIS